MHRLSSAGIAIVVALAVGAFAVLAMDRTAASATQEAVVSMQFNQFTPADVAVAAGSTVTWVNEDYDSGEWHDVIDENGWFVSDSFAPGYTFSITLWNPGVYVYYCDLHEDMYGRIFVE
ncbi:MAG: cupredoxin domain-containing protein [Dehalococcoidia bacterium]